VARTNTAGDDIDSDVVASPACGERSGAVTRIIGGVAGGRRIAVPPRGTRPTTDRVRESLFNILTARRDLTGLSVLDLYAGSGALGLEALSRGAASALFVESNHRAVAVLARNIQTLGLTGATLRRGAVATVLAAGGAGPVDVVLADPPYEVEAKEIDALLAALTAHGWVVAGTVIVMERASGSAPLNWPAGWYTWQQRVYGDTRLELAELSDPGC
jgi:16S rRNA (guanine966-N2)-methyltransferase